MGLELTCIAMDSEERFGITIEEDYRFSTVGSLYHYILTALESTDSSCPTVPVFFRLRNAFLRHTRHNKSAITPETRLAELLPRLGRRRLWRRITRETRLELPDLPGLLPGWLHLLVSVVFGIALSAGAFYFLGMLLNGMRVAPLSQTMAILYSGTFAILIFALPCAIAVAIALPAWIPRDWTLAHVVNLFLSEHPASFGPHGKQWDAESVWLSLRDILTRNLDVGPELITPDAHLIKDLRAS
ncbi:MAG: hypothetical protein RBU21_16525 [FCB group bacterium]|jgi:acyl carrier protein|nr:hypothetical protein [FCB group bacterium]